ncbi:MAG: hypothetical protein Q8M02_13685 [Candidatus Didemnitutus sp.]|nr:hypothetical protein [Candidatus Didemnitutus sp.]
MKPFLLIFAALCCAVLMASAAPVPEQYRGDWLLVNGVVVLHIADDSTMTLRNSGATGSIDVKDNGDFTWHLPEQPQSGRFADGKLLLKSAQDGSPKWMEHLEFRRGAKEVASEVIEFALRQQTQALGAFERVRRSSQEKAILNNLRQLSAAADQFFLEHGVHKVTLEQLVGPEPEKFIKQLTPVDGEDYRKLDLSQNAKSWKITSESGITVTYDR